MEMRLLALIAVVLSLTAVSFDLSRRPLAPQQEALVPSGAQGKLALPDAEFKPLLDRATNEMNQRIQAGKQYIGWKRAVGWLALALSAGVSLVGAFYGRNPQLKPGAEVADVLGAVERPQKTVRIVCMMLATSSILTLLAQNLEAESASLIGSGKTLSEAIIESTATLYDPQTTEVKARVALRKLEVAIAE